MTREADLLTALKKIEQLNLGPDRGSAGAIAEAAYEIARDAIKAYDGVHKFVERTPTNDQIAAVMLQNGNYDQIREALDYISGRLPAPESAPVTLGPIGDICIDCDGSGKYPSGATCKSCEGTGRVLPGDGIPVPPIPAGVYYVGEADNFYNAANYGGMGQEFYRTWRDRRSEFPKTPMKPGEKKE